MRRTRRELLGGLVLASLGGCGFTPLYGSAGGGMDSAASRGLGETTVALIPERTGQLLRQALQARFYGAGEGLPRLFELRAAFSVANESVAIRTDNTATRARLIGTAVWSLVASDPAAGTLASGTARAVDGYNVFDQQYFAADLASETAQRRVAEATADSITMQLAIYFKKRGVA